MRALEPTIRIERGELPGGRTAMILQADGTILLRVDPQEITERGALALARIIQNEINAGRLRQDWPGDESPGQNADGA